MQVRGIIPPLVTPMTSDEEVDLATLRRLIDHQIACRVHGIFVLGTTGECYALDAEEKQKIVAATVEHVNKRVPVYAGTGAETTREAIRHTRMAERERVDGVSVITPYFIMPNQSEIADHYRRIAESTALPVVLYSNPSTCGGLRIRTGDGGETGLNSEHRGDQGFVRRFAEYDRDRATGSRAILRSARSRHAYCTRTHVWRQRRCTCFRQYRSEAGR